MKYHKSNLLTILPKNHPKLWALNAHRWATDAQHMGYRCPSRGLLSAHQMGIGRPTTGFNRPTKWADFQEISAVTSNDINMTFSDFS